MGKVIILEGICYPFLQGTMAMWNQWGIVEQLLVPFLMVCHLLDTESYGTEGMIKLAMLRS